MQTMPRIILIKLKRIRFYLLTYSLTSLLTFLWFSSMSEACPGCKDALTDPAGLPQRLSMARGYALSIGLLLGMPAALVAGLTVLVIRAARRSRRAAHRRSTSASFF